MGLFKTPSFIKDIEDSVKDVGYSIDDAFASLTGKEAQKKAISAAEAAQQSAVEKAMAEKQTAATEAIGFFDPFRELESQAISGASFLTDPEQQFNFLQSNPLYQSALDRADRATMSNLAARGKLGSGDTLTSLAENTLLQAQPLLDRQTSNVRGLLDFARANTVSRANARLGLGSDISSLLETQGNVSAASSMAKGNASAAARQGLLGLAGQVGGAALAGPVGGAVGGLVSGAFSGGAPSTYNLDYSLP